MIKSQSYQLKGKYQKPIAVDVCWNEEQKEQPIVVFIHGFKGFKDWGHWQQIAIAFAEAGYCFVKFNFSHNGTTPEDLVNFVDLEAFGQNNYSKELADLQTVLDWIEQSSDLKQIIDWNEKNISLIGHSRGGPIALIGAKENASVLQVITWASVHELNYVWQNKIEALEHWQKEGVYHVLNGRTQQNMPLYYQLVEDYQAHEKRLSVKATLQALNKPYLIVHGSADPAVPAYAADYLYQHAKDATLYMIENANHVFGGSHPFVEKELPTDSKVLVEKSLAFLEKQYEK